MCYNNITSAWLRSKSDIWSSSYTYSSGTGITNYDAESVAAAKAKHDKCGVPCRIMIDCSHGNSLKKAANQPGVASAVAEQVAAGSRYDSCQLSETNYQLQFFFLYFCGAYSIAAVNMINDCDYRYSALHFTHDET